MKNFLRRSHGGFAFGIDGRIAKLFKDALLVIDESTLWDFELADQDAVAVEMRYKVHYTTAYGNLATPPGLT